MINKMKRLVSALLVCVMLLLNVSVFAAEDINVLKSMGIAPDSITEAVGGEKITRGEFAYMLANLLTNDELAPMDTRFSDVTKADYMSGHVEFLATRGIAGGYGDGRFGKDDPMTLEIAYVFLLRLLGLDSFVKGEESYTSFASTIGLKVGNYTDSDGHVTKAGAAAIIYDALTASLPQKVWGAEANGYILSNEDKTTLISKKLGISSYDAFITAVNMEKYTVTCEITKSRDKTNPLEIPVGTVKTFMVSPNVNIYEFENTPVSILIDEDEKIIDIQCKKGVEIRYVNIFSVNDDGEENAYRVESIKRMTFLDDEEEYDVIDGATYKINGKSFTGMTTLVGKFAKVVLQNGEITHVESWDLTEGGIITDITEESLSYIQGDRNRKLTELDQYKNKLFFIGDRCASYSEIKTDSVFYYYENKEESSITLVVSELVVTDILTSVSMSPKQMTIGNNVIAYKDKFYYKTTGTAYKKSTEYHDYTDIYNKEVSAYITHNGKVLYISPHDASVIDSSFYGVVVGIETDMWDNSEGDIKLISLNGKEVKEEQYKITKKTQYEGDITIEDLKRNARNKYGNGIYKFRVNKEGLVTKVETPQRYFNYPTAEEGAVTTTATLYNYQGELYLNTGNNVMGVIYLKPSVIYAINDVGGKFFVETWGLSDVLSKTPAQPLKIILYGDGKSLQPGLVAMASKEGTDSLGAFGKGRTNYGVITEKNHAYYNDEEKIELVVEGTSGKSSYYVTQATADKYKVNTMIKYTVGADYAEDQILITASADLSGDPEKWDLSKVMTTVTKGTVDYADTDGLVMTDGRAFFYRKAENDILTVDMTGAKIKYEKGTPASVTADDKVFFYTSEGIRFMIDVKY